MKTFTAGKDARAGGDPDSREWVFGVLGSSRHRQRMQQLERLDLRRRPGCEPCLRAMVVGDWSPETLFHVGWCDSCGAAATALGLAAASGAGAPWYRRRATWLAVAALAVLALPLAGSQMTGSDQGYHHRSRRRRERGRHGGRVGNLLQHRRAGDVQHLRDEHLRDIRHLRDVGLRGRRDHTGRALQVLPGGPVRGRRPRRSARPQGASRDDVGGNPGAPFRLVSGAPSSPGRRAGGAATALRRRGRSRRSSRGRLRGRATGRGRRESMVPARRPAALAM